MIIHAHAKPFGRLLIPAIFLPALLLGQLVPGDRTDPTAPAQAKKARAGFQMPEEWKAPYVATYYVEPTVSPDVETSLSFFVTDWDNSKIRFGDDSHRFDVSLRYTADGTNWTTRSLQGLPDGDHTVSLGKLPAGDYTLGILCSDEKGRRSHTVWHEFRSRAAASLAIPADKIRRMTDGDLAAYSIRNDGDHGRLVPVEVGDLAKVPAREAETRIRAALDQAVSAGTAPADGYVIYAAAHDDVPVTRAFKYSRILYGRDYDKETVATNALRTSEGLQRLVDDAAKAGFRKFVFLPGTYRLSHQRFLSVPDGMTIDLNGATLKMDGFSGDHGLIAQIANKRDAHLVNGIIEGDYYEHDYATSPNNSEWPMGIEIKGDARNCSFEDLTARQITGYGAGCGMDMHFPGYIGIGGADYTPGALRMTDGTVDPAALSQYTSGFRDIRAFTNKYITVSKYLGYQAVRSRSWLYTAAFYDADKNFLSAERAFQYRAVLIPDRAKYMRVTLVLGSIEEAKTCDLTAQLFKTPWNCAFRDIRFDRCRAVGLAPAAMRNMLIEGNEFTRCGEVLARCAFDAEDGWDMMQDVTIRGNRFHDNPFNELLTCAGHNFVIEKNQGDIYLWGRTLSPCVRDNDIGSAGFHCDNRTRTMHGRYLDNRYEKGLQLGLSDKATDWDIVVSGSFTNDTATPRRWTSSPTGRFRDCRFVGKGDAYVGSNFERCTFEGGEFIMTSVDFKFTGQDFLRTTFSHCNRTGTWENCTLKDCTITSSGPGTLTFRDSALDGTRYSASYWTKPVTLLATGCTIGFGTNNAALFRTPVYSIADLRFTGNTLTGPAAGGAVLELYDCRGQSATDDLPATITFSNNIAKASIRQLVRISDNHYKTPKKLTITATGNRLLPGTDLVNTNALRSHWKAELQ